MDFDALKLEKQLCFPLYACAKEVVRTYTPFLESIGLTYTQYIAMLVLWEYKEMTVKELGEHLFLDSGTITPLLKKMEAHGLVIRTRSISDERSVIISLSEEGAALREKAVGLPAMVGSCVSLSDKEAETLYQLLYKVLNTLHTK